MEHMKLLKPSLISPQETVKSTFNTVHYLLEKEIDLEKHTLVTLRDGNLIRGIGAFVGSRANRTFTIRTKESQDYLSDSDDEDKKTEDRTQLGMGWGWHQVTYEDHVIKLFYHAMGDPVGTSNCVQIMEVLVMLIEGLGKETIIQKFCNYIISLSEKTREKTFNVYQYNLEYSYWQKIATKSSRPVESVVLPPEIRTALFSDLEEFLSPETFKWYKSHGIPYKRSFLLYGPPGSGKSSVIQAIAGKYERNLCFVQPLNPKFTDDSFVSCVQSAPKNALVVLEDVDAYFGKDRETLHANCPLTFSGLLNALDGVGSADGQIFILTTNFIDRLDQALIRSGRVDKKFYPDAEKEAEIFRDSLAKYLSGDEKPQLCMADLQQHFISHRRNGPSLAANEIKDISGEEFKLLSERAEKEVKKKRKELEDGEEDEGDKPQPTTTSATATAAILSVLKGYGSEAASTLNHYILAGLGVGMGAGAVLATGFFGKKFLSI